MMICYNHLTMTHPTPIDITNIPELVRIAEEVEATKTPRELRRENKPVALITPVTGAKKAKKQQAKTKADYEAFRSWIRSHNQEVKQTGQGVRILACLLPSKSPWLNPIEAKW